METSNLATRRCRSWAACRALLQAPECRNRSNVGDVSQLVCVLRLILYVGTPYAPRRVMTLVQYTRRLDPTDRSSQVNLRLLISCLSAAYMSAGSRNTRVTQRFVSSGLRTPTRFSLSRISSLAERLGPVVVHRNSLYRVVVCVCVCGSTETFCTDMGIEMGFADYTACDSSKLLPSVYAPLETAASSGDCDGFGSVWACFGACWSMLL
jgi:hypothetical protein